MEQWRGQQRQANRCGSKQSPQSRLQMLTRTVALMLLPDSLPRLGSANSISKQARSAYLTQQVNRTHSSRQRWRSKRERWRRPASSARGTPAVVAATEVTAASSGHRLPRSQSSKSAFSLPRTSKPTLPPEHASSTSAAATSGSHSQRKSPIPHTSPRRTSPTPRRTSPSPRRSPRRQRRIEALSSGEGAHRYVAVYPFLSHGWHALNL